MLLTDEEILRIQNKYTEESRAICGGAFARDEKTELAFALSSIPQRVAEAQLKKVYEWGNEDCFDHPYRSRIKSEEYNRKKHRCPECWQSLLEEIK